MLAYEQYRDQGTQKLCQPAQEEAEVVTGGGEDGIDAVALTALEMVAVHAVFGLEMADDRHCHIKQVEAVFGSNPTRLGHWNRVAWLPPGRQ